MIKIKKINNEKVKPIKNIVSIDPTKIKAYNMFPSVYSNIFILAKKNSGKSTTIYNILKRGVNKNTIVYFFVSTIYKDKTYEEIIKMLDDMGVEHHEYTTIKEGKDNNLENIINTLQESPQEIQEEPKIKLKFIKCDNDDEDEEQKPYKPKKIAPEYIFIFDDISGELRSPAISTLIKKNRHFKSRIICSSQSLHDLTPASIQNLDYMLIFGHVPEEKLMIAHKNLDLSIPFNIFYDLYKHSTEQKYNFFYIDIRQDKFRKNFNQEYQIEN